MSVVERRVLISTDERGPGRRRVRIVDFETGELVNEYYDERRSKPSGRPPGSKGRVPEFFRIYRTNLRDIVSKRHLTFQEAGVLLHLLAYVGWESNFLVHPKTGDNLSESDLADLLNVSRTTMHEALRSLNRKGMLALVRRGEGRANHVLLNSHIAFFGRHIRDQAEHDVFNGGPYEPPSPITYREVPRRE